MREILNKFWRIFIVILAFLFSFESILAVEDNNFVVVIDPGHGGKDPGAVNGKDYEKYINLQVALALGDLIKKNQPNVTVIFTRKTDVYLTLQERADIANKSKAGLFISIHTNANNKVSAFGTETYTLGLTKSKSNLDVAMRENAVILLEDDYKVKYAGFDPNSADSYIMFECIQDRYLDKSLQFASEIQQSFEVTGRKNRGVRQAGFWVLHKTAMPSVLVEVGYLSNKEERKFLMSDAGQKKMAKAIYNSFDKFVTEYEKKSGNQNYVATASKKATEKPPVKKVVKKVEKKVEKKEKVVAVLSKEEEQQTQQFLDKMKAEASAEKAAPVENADAVSKPIPIEPIIETTSNVDQKASISLLKEGPTTVTEGVVFKLQLFALSKKKPLGDPVFKGLKLDYYVEGGLYKYTYGRTKDFERIKIMKKQISSKFPALIIAFKDGKRIPLNEALKK